MEPHPIVVSVCFDFYIYITRIAAYQASHDMVPVVPPTAVNAFSLTGLSDSLFIYVYSTPRYLIESCSWSQDNLKTFCPSDRLGSQVIWHLANVYTY